MSPVGAPVLRVAVISLHTSPFDPPGTGDSGGMNVEIRALAGRLGGRGIAVDIFTRCAGRGVPEIEQIGPLARVIQVPAGPCAEVSGSDLPVLVPAFTDGVIGTAAEIGPYDLVHAHYWLSGAAGIAAARMWGVPLVTSFHTLAEVKNLALADDDAPEPLHRVRGERRAIRASSRLIAPTEDHAHSLIELYGAQPGRVRVVPPGVDTGTFFPRGAAEARKRLKLGEGPVVLFAARLQRLKGPDVAVRAFAEAVRRAPDLMGEATLLIVGGPSGPFGGSIRPWLEGIAEKEGVTARVVFVPPQPHAELPWVYSAADVLLMPSRTESFGLAALEAQACGTPVVAAAVGGLRQAVREGVGGYLLRERDPALYASRVLEILQSPDLATRLSHGAVEHASRFPWGLTVDRLVGVYAEVLPALASAAAS